MTTTTTPILRMEGKRHEALRGVNILLGVTGSVATIKLAVLVSLLEASHANVKIVSTEAAAHFWTPLEPPSSSSSPPPLSPSSVSQLPRPLPTSSEVALPPSAHSFSSIPVYRDADEWKSWNSRGDPVLHIELRKWADVLLIAPLSANTLAKIANGFSDNLLTSVCRAWEFPAGLQNNQIIATSNQSQLIPSSSTAAPLSSAALTPASSTSISSQTPSASSAAPTSASSPKLMALCPAMNTAMWNHPITSVHLHSLLNLGVKIIWPISKQLMCGDIGSGAMEEPERIVEQLAQFIAERNANNNNKNKIRSSL